MYRRRNVACDAVTVESIQKTKLLISLARLGYLTLKNVSLISYGVTNEVLTTMKNTAKRARYSSVPNSQKHYSECTQPKDITNLPEYIFQLCLINIQFKQTDIKSRIERNDKKNCTHTNTQ